MTKPLKFTSKQNLLSEKNSLDYVETSYANIHILYQNLQF